VSQEPEKKLRAEQADVKDFDTPEHDLTRAALLRKAGALGALALTGSAVSAAGGASRAFASNRSARRTAAVTVNVLTPAGPRFGKPQKVVAKLFNRSHPGIRVRIEEIPLSQLYVKDGAALNSNSSAFDAIIIDPEFIPGVASKLTDIRPLLNADRKYKADITRAVPAPVRNYPSYKGVLYGLPTDVSTHLMYYRKDLFDKAGLKPPETFDDALEVAKELTGNTNQGKQYGYTMQLARTPFAGITLTEMILCYGGQVLVGKNFQPRLYSDEGVAALTMLTQLMKYADPGTVNAGDNEVVQALATGVAVFAPNTSVNAGFQDKNVSKFWDVTAAHVVPKGPGTKGKHTPWLNGLFYSIPAASKHKKESFAFGKYLSGAPVMRTFVQNTGQPARTDALRKYVSIWPYFAALRQTLPNAVPFPLLPQWFPLLDPLGTEVFNTIQGRKSPDQAMKDAQSAWVKILRDAGYDVS
jgi:multiple sugar transport system substrate-binding protein